MSASNYADLLPHLGHKLMCVSYGDLPEPANVAIECVTCGIVLLDFDRTDPRPPKPITDLSDKGRNPNPKRLKYEVGYWATHSDIEQPVICAKFGTYGDALLYARQLAETPDPTRVLIR